MRVGRAERRVEKIVGAVAVAAVVLGGGSYWTGSRVEQEFREGVKLAAEHGVAVNVVDYQRGIFGSTARTDVTFQVPSAEDPSITESVTVPIVHDIRHGPLPALTAAARIHSEAQTTEDNAEYLTETFGEAPSKAKSPLVFDVVIGWAGGRDLSVVSSKIEAEIKGIKIKKFHQSKSGEGASGDSGWDADIVIGGPSFIKSNEDVINSDRIEFKSNMSTADGFKRVYTGTTNIMLEKFHFQGKDDNGAVRSVELKNFHVAGEASVKDGVLGTEVKFDADEIVTKGDGKEAVDHFKLKLQFENIDARAYDTILQTWKGNEDQAQAQAMAAVFQEQVGVLLQRKPVLSIKDASGHWPEGMVTGSFRIAYVGNVKHDDDKSESLPMSNLDSNLQMMVPRALVMRHMSAQASERITDSLEDGEEKEVNVGEETKKQVDKQMAAMLEEGIFVEKGDSLTVDAQLQKGELHLNGKPQQIENLFKLIPPFF